LFHIVIVGSTVSDGPVGAYPTTAGVFQPAYAGGKGDGIVTELALVPTAVRVSKAAAAGAPGGGGGVQWARASGADHLGFRLLSAPGPDGPFTPVSSRLLTAWASPDGGSTYRYHDPAGTAATWYQIEGLDTHNGSERFTPFPVGKALPALAAGPSAAQQA